MYTFSPALDAELAYRRQDIRSSFRSTRRFRIRRTSPRADASTGTRAYRPTPAGADVTSRTASRTA